MSVWIAQTKLIVLGTMDQILQLLGMTLKALITLCTAILHARFHAHLRKGRTDGRGCVCWCWCLRSPGPSHILVTAQVTCALWHGSTIGRNIYAVLCQRVLGQTRITVRKLSLVTAVHWRIHWVCMIGRQVSRNISWSRWFKLLRQTGIRQANRRTSTEFHWHWVCGMRRHAYMASTSMGPPSNASKSH